MAKTFADVKAKAERDSQFLAQLIINPKKALKDANLSLEDPGDIHRLELFAFSAQEQLRTAGKLVGIQFRKADWGIGAGCCNKKILVTGRGRPEE